MNVIRISGLAALLLLLVSCFASQDVVSNPSYTIAKSRYYYSDIDSVIRIVYDFIREYDAELIKEDAYHIDFQRVVKGDQVFVAKEIQYKLLIFKDQNATKVTVNIFEMSEALGRNVEPANKLSQRLYKEFWAYLDKRLSN